MTYLCTQAYTQHTDRYTAVHAGTHKYRQKQTHTHTQTDTKAHVHAHKRTHIHQHTDRHIDRQTYHSIHIECSCSQRWKQPMRSNYGYCVQQSTY